MSQTNTIREDLASLRASHDAHMEALTERLNGIIEHLDTLNGTQRAHGLWIAGREPICIQSMVNLKALTDAVTLITTYLAEERGGKKTRARMVMVINAVVIAATAICSAWAAVHMVLATVHR